MSQKMISLTKVMMGVSIIGVYGMFLPNQVEAVNCWEIYHDLAECSKHDECMISPGMPEYELPDGTKEPGVAPYCAPNPAHKK